MKRKVQIVAVFFLVLAVALLFPFTNWNSKTSIYGFISLILGTIGSGISIFIPSVYVYKIKLETWQLAENNKWVIKISKAKHGMGSSPNIQLFGKNNLGYEQVLADNNHDEKGNVEVIVPNAFNRFEGKILIS